MCTRDQPTNSVHAVWKFLRCILYDEQVDVTVMTWQTESIRPEEDYLLRPVLGRQSFDNLVNHTLHMAVSLHDNPPLQTRLTIATQDILYYQISRSTG